MTQLPLLAGDMPSPSEPYTLRGGLPPHNQSATSIAAAESVVPKANAGLWVVLRYVAAHVDGATRDAIEVGTGMRIPVVCARVDDLLKLGMLEEPGTIGLTRSGRKAKLLVVTPAGRVELAR